VPLALGGALMALMTSWERGRGLMLAQRRQDGALLAPFVARLPRSRIVRVPGTAVFLTGNPDNVPTALLHNLKHNKVLHERVLCVGIGTLDVPEAEPGRRGQVEELAPGFYRAHLDFGFMEEPDVPRALADFASRGMLPFEPMQASYFLNRPTVVPSEAPQMPAWRRWLFRTMERNAASGAEFLRIPADRVVELGLHVAL
jgi:KUP system potassium uptake protein